MVASEKGAGALELFAGLISNSKQAVVASKKGVRVVCLVASPMSKMRTSLRRPSNPPGTFQRCLPNGNFRVGLPLGLG